MPDTSATRNVFWDTSLLYPSVDGPELADDFSLAADEARAFGERYRGKIASLDADGLLEALNWFESFQTRFARPQCFAHLLFSADSGDPVNKQLMQKGMEVGTAVSRDLLFFELELMALPDETVAGLGTDPRFAPYLHFIAMVRKFRHHTLSEQEERLLKLKELTGVHAFSKLYDELSASFTFSFELDGEEKDMTGEELLGLLHHHDARVRERAFTLFLDRHRDHGIVYGTVFNNLALDFRQELDLRNYRHPMEPTNLGNELTSEIVDRLMTVTEANYSLARDYFRIKARLLGLPRLKNCDIYAPLRESDRHYTLDEARNLVLDAYGDASEEFRSIIAGFFDGNRIDAFPRTGKSGGAFCMGISPELPPYILLNFTGNLRDVSTLAHELGHGLHFVLSAEQNMLNYHAPLPLSETASVFGEMLLTRNLLARESDRTVKASLLCAKIEDIIATTFRQNVLTRFEERFHLERRTGLLSEERISDIWWEENEKLYGDAVEMIPSYRWGWSYISHFVHARFYCYSYVFAELLVLSLYRLYLDQGRTFIPGYRQLLASGGSVAPAETVAPLGIELSAPDFWQKGYDYLAELIEELQHMTDGQPT